MNKIKIFTIDVYNKTHALEGFVGEFSFRFSDKMIVFTFKEVELYIKYAEYLRVMSWLLENTAMIS